MNLKSLIISFLVLIGGNIMGQNLEMNELNENEEYMIWGYVHSSGTRTVDSSPNQVEFYEEDELYMDDANFVRALPIEIKTIIAAYTQFNTYLFETEFGKYLAETLGGFKSLDEAREKLLVHLKNKIPPCQPFSLSIRRSGEFLYFSHNGAFEHNVVVDKFQINADGTVQYVPDPLVYIPYERKKLADDYEYRHMMQMLNGEEVDYYWCLYLDPNNVESVAVDKRNRRIDITQKDTETEYFSLSMVNLDSLDAIYNVKVKNIDEIGDIYVFDENNDRNNYIRGHTIIEKSCVKSLGAGQEEDYPDLKWLYIKLKRKDEMDCKN